MKMQNDDCGETCGCNAGLPRRDFLGLVGAGAVGLLSSRLPVMAGPFELADFEKLVPPDKKLNPAWVKSLFERGAPTVYRGDAELKYIGMPVGGMNSGQLYLGGDGTLWHWDIFNQHWGTGDAHYAHPPLPHSQIHQGFRLRIDSGAQPKEFSLDRAGFSDVSFCGQYPIGVVEYKEPTCPVEVRLEAFSPFIPLDVENSSLPVTVMRYTIKNTSATVIEATLAGVLENAVCIESRNSMPGAHRNRILDLPGMTFLNCSAEEPAPPDTTKADSVFENWDQDTFTGWTVEGDAFGKGPVKRSDFPGYMGEIGGEGARVANSHAAAPGATIEEKDAKTGKLISKDFTIRHGFIRAWIGGGNHAGKTCLNVVVDGKVVGSLAGSNENRLGLKTLDVRQFKSKAAHLEIVDAETGPWGNIGVGRILFTDRAFSGKFEDLEDYGTMGLALLGAPAEHRLAAAQPNGLTGNPGDEASAPWDRKLLGALGRKFKLEPAQSADVTFVLSWHFPNLRMGGFGKPDDRVGRHYETRFASAQEVAGHVAASFDSLSNQTRLWRDTWYDSTLPYWFLDRTFQNISTLATSTLYRFRDGRLYGNEGVGCCAGTCTHVYHYEQALGRLFPQLDILLRERADFNPKAGFNADGGIGMRGEFDRTPAVDGQAGVILRAYRDHQMSVDSTFLHEYWQSIKRAIQYLIRQDGNGDGILGGAQHNTLDAAWYGEVPWLSSLYLAALHAGEAMALEMQDNTFAAQCRALQVRGAANFVAQMWKPQYGYFVQVPDPAHKGMVGAYDGCDIDQVFGQEWAFQVGLGRVLPAEETKKALASIWRFNFTPDVGPYRKVHKSGRWYAMSGEGGVIGCTWPFGDASRVPTDFDYYFNECMPGFEYEPAAHMIWEGMAMEGFAIARTLHDRYHASRRNPWNEVECGDHYARSMSSYGLFTAACGFEYHGPRGYMAFEPRVTPEDFRAPFTSAEGWGTYSQKETRLEKTAALEIKWGKLRLKTLALAAKAASVSVRAELDGQTIALSRQFKDGRVLITFAEEVRLTPGQRLQVVLS
jgi:non-lysosomal glucosylceramidase